jgi:hypothetical protein
MSLEILIIAVAIVLFLFVVEVVRRRQLSEGYAMLWIAVAIGGVLLGVARHLVDRFSDSIGVSYGANLVFAFVFVFLLIVAINLSMHVSKLEDRVTSLAEELALLRGPHAATPTADDTNQPAPAVPTGPTAPTVPTDD